MFAVPTIPQRTTPSFISSSFIGRPLRSFSHPSPFSRTRGCIVKRSSDPRWHKESNCPPADASPGERHTKPRDASRHWPVSSHKLPSIHSPLVDHRAAPEAMRDGWVRKVRQTTGKPLRVWPRITIGYCQLTYCYMSIYYV